MIDEAKDVFGEHYTDKHRRHVGPRCRKVLSVTQTCPFAFSVCS